jgi:anti-anti-sigma factor
MAANQYPFEATVRFDGNKAFIDMAGDIDGFAEDAINAAYSDAEAENPQVVMLNFSNIHYINSTGIALIVGLLARARGKHTNLVTYGLSDHYVEIFTITRLSDFMTIASDEASALAQIS